MAKNSNDAHREGSVDNSLSITLREKCEQFVLILFRMTQFAFPYNNVAPAKRIQFGLIPQIARPVSFEFGPPKVQSGLRHARQGARRIGMPMPKAAVDEHHFLPARENYVGPTR